MATSSSSSPSTNPVLRGVIFDMDGTLTKPNLDFGEMYRRCGVDPSHDILQVVNTMSDAAEQQRARDIIEEMEEEGRRTLELMPGAKELVSWLDAHGIPMAIVTRNTQKTTDVLLTGRMMLSTGNDSFSPVIARDAGYPPKPDPTAMSAIAKAWNAELPTDSFLMVGDSLSNDVAFGKNAGVQTALLDSGRRYQESLAGKPDVDELSPNFVTDTLWGLPRQLWKVYSIDGTLGNSQPSIPKVLAPEPTTPLTLASANGDLAVIESLLRDDSERINAVDDSGNTALIWAVERNQEAVVEMLLSQSITSTINVNVRGFLGATAVSRAARRGFDSLVKLLLQHGANPDVPNDKLQHPLHFAAFKQHPTCVRILVEQGANPLVLDRKGRTPALDTSNEEIRTLLLEAEARHELQYSWIVP